MGRFWSRLRKRIGRYLANDDPLASAANSGAFLVWSSQPLYPLYVWLLVGHDAWPALVTWLSTPFFFVVPLVARRSPIAGRVLFVAAGLSNTLISLKAFGPRVAIGWFLVPCLAIAVGFFRARDWGVAALLSLLVGLAALLAPHVGRAFVDYPPLEARSLSHLNLWSAIVLTAYLVYAAVRARQAVTE